MKEEEKKGGGDQQKLAEADLEKGVMDEGSCLPVESENFLGEGLVFPLDRVSLRVGFVPPLLDYAPQGRGWASPLRRWAPPSRDQG